MSVWNFVFFANFSIVVMNVSLMPNSVGFYQVNGAGHLWCYSLSKETKIYYDVDQLSFSLVNFSRSDHKPENTFLPVLTLFLLLFLPFSLLELLNFVFFKYISFSPKIIPLKLIPYGISMIMSLMVVESVELNFREAYIWKIVFDYSS